MSFQVGALRVARGLRRYAIFTLFAWAMSLFCGLATLAAVALVGLPFWLLDDLVLHWDVIGWFSKNMASTRLDFFYFAMVLGIPMFVRYAMTDAGLSEFLSYLKANLDKRN